MEKPDNPYKPGTILYRLLDEDWSRKSIFRIVDELESTEISIRNCIYLIKRKTGYKVPFLHVSRIPKQKRGDCHISLSEQPKGIENGEVKKCDTCWNVDCCFMTERMAVCWVNCDGWIG